MLVAVEIKTRVAKRIMNNRNLNVQQVITVLFKKEVAYPVLKIKRQ